ncbi:hypothetical protein M422DRAFT_28369 [Sphaerobolus stellatus SS14]|nr:hypothetical protein M422DRAFT_28369 [Sphaerobolus stellatus SS14]
MTRLSALLLSISFVVYVVTAPLPTPQLVPLLGDVDQDGIPFANLTLPSQGGEFPSFLEEPPNKKSRGLIFDPSNSGGLNPGFGGHRSGGGSSHGDDFFNVEEHQQGGKPASAPAIQQPSKQPPA